MHAPTSPLGRISRFASVLRGRSLCLGVTGAFPPVLIPHHTQADGSGISWYSKFTATRWPVMGCMHPLPTLHGPMSTLTPKALPLTDSRFRLDSQPSKLGPSRGHILVALARFYGVASEPVGLKWTPPPTRDGGVTP